MQQTAPPQTRSSIFDPEIRTLPSGHSGLARDLVDASQRQRLMHAVVHTVCEKGYGPTTVADISASAGVSKKTFYAHFADKQMCFLAAYELGRGAMLDAVQSAVAEAGPDPIEQLRISTAAYLEFLVTEEFYARVFFLETLAAGPEAVACQRHCRDDFSASLRVWHESARHSHPDWPAASELAYEAATGAVYEITLDRVARGRATELPTLLDALVDIQLSVLRIPPVSDPSNDGERRKRRNTA